MYFIPKKKYYKSEYFNEYLFKKNIDINATFNNDNNNIFLNNNENSAFSDINSDNINITNFTNIIDEIEEKLKTSLRVNQTILAFSIIILIGSFISIYLLFLVLLLPENSDKYNEDYFKLFFISLFIKFAFVFINVFLALSIIVKILKIKKNIDNIGFTNEIKNKVLLIFILLCFCFVYYFTEIGVDYKKKEELLEMNIREYNKEKQDNAENTENDDLKERIRGKEKEINLLTERINTKDNEINKQKKERDILEERINGLSNENKNLKEKNKELEQKIIQKDEDMLLKLKQNDVNINKYKEKDAQKDLEIANLKKINNLGENEKIMTVIFNSVDQKIHYAMICKNTDKFATIEQNLYDIFPEYKETENYFLLNAQRINKSKTFEENGIKFSDIIILNVNE